MSDLLGNHIVGFPTRRLIFVAVQSGLCLTESFQTFFSCWKILSTTKKSKLSVTSAKKWTQIPDKLLREA